MDLWQCNVDGFWRAAEDEYLDCVNPDILKLEKEMENISADGVKNMTAEEFYDFICDKYFVWQYPNPYRAKKIKDFEKEYAAHMKKLGFIQKSIFSFNLIDTARGIEVAKKIKGVGVVGATGLLAILFPQYFGVVNSKVVEELKKFEAFSFDAIINEMDPGNIKDDEAVYVEKLLRKKAAEMNRENHTDYWTPRKIDKVLWAYDRQK